MEAYTLLQPVALAITVEAGPFPDVGAAGYYFGKLSSATTNKVPTDTRPGWFNPVIVFGFGAQVGLGKSIEAGILSAGFSVTVFGIRLNWLVLAVLVYPLLYGIGRFYVRLAEQSERDFVRVVDAEP